MDEYQNRRLERYLQDIISWYEGRLPGLKPGTEVHKDVEEALQGAKDTLALHMKRNRKH